MYEVADQSISKLDGTLDLCSNQYNSDLQLKNTSSVDTPSVKSVDEISLNSDKETQVF